MNIELMFDETSSGILSPEDLHFFYYDVGLENMSNAPVLYDWNDSIQSFVDNKRMTINGYEREAETILSETYEDAKLLFLINNGETKEEAFFRHLRNAFAHYNICRRGDDFLLKDIDSRNHSVTMIGCVKADDLKDLCLLFIGQKTKYEDTFESN